MKLKVTYKNTLYKECDEYMTTLEEFVDSFNGSMSIEAVKKVLQDRGEASIEIGDAITKIELI
jgi:hypothetical protein